MEDKWTGRQKAWLGDKYIHICEVMAEEQLIKKKYKNKVMGRMKKIRENTKGINNNENRY